MSNPWLDAARALDATLAELARNQALGQIAEQVLFAQSSLAQLAAIVAADDPTLAASLVGISDLLADAAGTARQLAGHPEPAPLPCNHHQAPAVMQ